MDDASTAAPSAKPAAQPDTSASSGNAIQMDTTPAPAQSSASGQVQIAGRTVEEHTKTGFSQIVDIMRAVNAFPSGPTRTLYTAHPSFNRLVDATSQRLLATIAKVLAHQQIRGNIARRDADEQLELLLECNDFMLERINGNLDELAGIRKLPESAQLIASQLPQSPQFAAGASGSWNHKAQQHSPAVAAKLRTTKLLTARNILRPQINFKTPVDNSNNAPFEPRLRDKPHSLKPLAILPEYGDDGDVVSYLHPYEFELEKFEVPAEFLSVAEGGAQLPRSLAETRLVHVATVAELAELLDDLRKAPAVAIDLEHHSYRTFQGITCLMQISTRSVDYIVDTLVLRDELHVLNEVFADPRVVKVLHGADSDVEWLQRDLSLYLVNVFDTHQAAKRLGLARLSLAFLLKQYCELEVDKTFQLADWRIRPLPEELVLYARQDTHYLLYVWDVMRAALREAANGGENLLRAVWQASTEICKKRYIKPRATADSHMEMYSRSRRTFDNRQLHALQSLYAWRDKIARQEDESTGYVLPNHMLLQVAEVLPREMQGILACCNPIPPLVRQHLHALHSCVLRAREQPLVRSVSGALGDDAQQRAANPAAALGALHDLSGPLYCPHDQTQAAEFRDDLPTLLGDAAVAAGEKTAAAIELPAAANVAEHSACSAFDTPENSDAEADAKLQRLQQLRFVSPFARYVAILPVAEKERAAEEARRAKADSLKRLCPERPVEDAEQKADAAKAAVAEAVAAKLAEARQLGDMLPLKDFGKRRRGELTDAADGPKTPVAKRARFEINVRAETPGDGAAAPADGAAPSTPATPAARTPRQKQKPGRAGSNRKSGQSSSKPVQQPPTTPANFDYSQVDARKFQGGSAQQVNTSATTSKFHGKNKGKRGQDKKFNKLLTFNKAGGGVAKRK